MPVVSQNKVNNKSNQSWVMKYIPPNVGDNKVVYKGKRYWIIEFTSKDKIDKLVLLDVLGNVVQVIVKPINNQFDFSESESGVYFIQIYSDDKVISKKMTTIIISHKDSFDTIATLGLNLENRLQIEEKKIIG